MSRESNCNDDILGLCMSLLEYMKEARARARRRAAGKKGGRGEGCNLIGIF